MAEPYVGEVRLVGFNFAPQGWMFCDGSVIPISENEVLFNLIGTTYGGDGQETFALPDLRGRVPLHQGSNFVMGQLGGEESVTLNVGQMPSHRHNVQVSGNMGTTAKPQNAYPAKSARKIYGVINSDTLSHTALTATGSSLPHENRQPLVAMNYIISLFGIFPSQT